MSRAYPDTVERWQIRAKPEGSLTEQDFVLVPVSLPDVGAGDVAIKVLGFSLDPYLLLQMRSWQGEPAGWDKGHIRGRVYGQVLESRDARFAVGDVVWGVGHWQAYDVLPAAGLTFIPDDGLPPSTALGVVGRSGLTSWVGMKLADPKPGQTLVVSSALGPVGSVVGQIAKIHGLRTIGIAGGADKCRQAVEDYGFDICIDHNAPDLAEQLAAAAPNGIDIDFENVGAKTMDPVLGLMNRRGKIILCGMIQHYNTTGPVALENFRKLMLSSITLIGFATADYMEWFEEGEAELRQWVKNGQMRYVETIHNDFAKAPSAFLAMHAGKGRGKHIMHLADPAPRRG